jgi:ABC-type lipoprotein release transport system permease subunit
MGAGPVTVQHALYQELPSLKKTVSDVDELVAAAQAEPEVVAALPRVSGAAMLASARGSYGASFLAVDPERESAETFEILGDITEGEFFASADDKGIILGSKLAENLDVTLGKRVVYTLTDKHGEIVSGLARVSGIVHSGAPSLDAGLCLLPLGTVREVLGYAPDQATQVAVFLRDNRDAEAVAARLRAAASQDAVAMTWKETQPDLYGFISMKRSSTVVIEVILMLLIGAGIFNSLFVSVMERLREFGIMIAVGFSPGQIFGLVMWESLWLGVTGLLAAALVTAAPYYHLNTKGLDMSQQWGEKGPQVAGVAMDPTLFVAIYPENLIAIAVVVLVATMAAGLYPAWKAGRVEPVAAIKLV